MAHGRTPRSTPPPHPRPGGLRRLRIILGLLGLAVFAAAIFVIAVVALQRSFLVAPSTAAQIEPSTEPLPKVSTPAPDLPSGPLDYVAMGDSYAAGPGLTPTRDDPAACERSANNYPAYLAQLLQVETYRDVSCTGARAGRCRGRQRRPDGTLVTPQSHALGLDTDLVTLSLGGNELQTLQDVVDACYVRATTQPDAPHCDEALRAEGSLALDRARQLEGAVADSMRQIRNAAPNAAVVMVSYPRVFPSTQAVSRAHHRALRVGLSCRGRRCHRRFDRTCRPKCRGAIRRPPWGERGPRHLLESPLGGRPRGFARQRTCLAPHPARHAVDGHGHPRRADRGGCRRPWGMHGHRRGPSSSTPQAEVGRAQQVSSHSLPKRRSSRSRVVVVIRETSARSWSLRVCTP